MRTLANRKGERERDQSYSFPLRVPPEVAHSNLLLTPTGQGLVIEPSLTTRNLGKYSLYSGWLYTQLKIFHGNGRRENEHWRKTSKFCYDQSASVFSWGTVCKFKFLSPGRFLEHLWVFFPIPFIVSYFRNAKNTSFVVLCIFFILTFVSVYVSFVHVFHSHHLFI